MTSRQKAIARRRLAIVCANLRAGLVPDEIKGESMSFQPPYFDRIGQNFDGGEPDEWPCTCDPTPLEFRDAPEYRFLPKNPNCPQHGESLDAKAADGTLPAAAAVLRANGLGPVPPVPHDGPTFEDFLFGDHRSVDPDPRLSSIIPRSVRWSRLEALSAAMDTAAAARSQYHGIRGLPGGNNGGVDGSAGR